MSSSTKKKELCTKWSKNPNINPVDGKAMHSSGLLYRKYKTLCKSIGITPKTRNDNDNQKGTRNEPDDLVALEECYIWAKDPLWHPVTRKPLKWHGRTYTALKNKCATHNIHLLDDSQDTNAETFYIPSPRKIPVPYQPHCIIRKCASFNFRPVQDPRARTHVIQQVEQCTVKPYIYMAYNELNLCEAPNNFNANHYMMLHGTESNNQLYCLLTSYLSILYGNSIIEGIWRVDSNKMDIYQSYKFDDGFITNPSKCPKLLGLSDIIAHIRKNNIPLCTLFVGARHPTKPTSHAMVLVFLNNPKTGELSVSVINPYMQHKNDPFVSSVHNILRFHMPSLRFCLLSSIADSHVRKRFQAANGRVVYTPLDPTGYCGVWAVLLMELISLRHANTKLDIFHDSKPQLNWTNLAGLLHLNIPESPIEIWRKLIVDYFFSRLVDTHALAATVLKRDDIASDLYYNVLGQYIDQFHYGNTIQAIRNYVPKFYFDVVRRIQNNVLHVPDTVYKYEQEEFAP